MWPGVNGTNDSPVSCWVCRKISCVCNWTRLCLTVPKMTEGLSCAQWSAVRCSDWRRGSLGATLVAVPWKRHEVTLQNDTARGEGKKKWASHTGKGAYISRELAWSFCRSHTNSLYLLLTLEIFSVKHMLLVYTGRQKCNLNVSVAGIETPLSPFFLLTCRQIS